jgi:antitoxin PrlF
MGYALTKKGQVTVPKHIREKLGVKPGDRVDFKVDAREEVVLVKTHSGIMSVADRLQDFVGCFQSDLTTDALLDLTRGEERHDTPLVADTEK